VRGWHRQRANIGHTREDSKFDSLGTRQESRAAQNYYPGKGEDFQVSEYHAEKQVTAI
jgi:hypothetical protein